MNFMQVRGVDHMAIARGFLAAIMLISVPVIAHAQNADVYRERIRSAQVFSALPDAAFGEQYDLYKGELSFHQEDLRLPGTGPDIVVGRTFAVGNWQDVVATRGFQDWEITIPRLEAKSPATPVWQVSSTGNYDRCTHFMAQPPQYTIINSHRWWNGVQLVDQSGASRDAMARASGNSQAPGGAVSGYTGVTKDNWQFSCLSQTANGQPGEAMLGLAPDGTKYWFNWLVLSVKANAYAQEGLDGRTYRMDLYKASMLVTRIEDRFGNYLTYTYDGSKLTSISGSDGRLVTFTWATDGSHITGMTTAGRTWTYEYATSRLSRLVYPDGTDMRFNLDALRTIYTTQSTLDCNPTPDEESMLDGGLDPTAYIGSITGPSGLTGTFTVKQTLHGRSRVPAGCNTINNTSTATVAALFVANSLVTRQYTGPGGVNLAWQYQYGAPAASWSSCTTCSATAMTTVIDPDGSVSRSTYSTEWGAYEGKLLLQEDGVTSAGVLRTTAYQYAPTAGMPYPSAIGDLPFTFDLANTAPAMTKSPLSKKTVTQQGRTFIWEVAATCGGTGDQLCFDAYARPTRMVKGSTP